MKAVKPLLSIAAMLFAVSTFAETIVFAPGNGVTTNVSERLAAGVDIQVNEGTSGGGIVNLLDPMNGAIGTATVKSGTLGVETLRRSSQKGGIGTLSLGNGTFRYAGPASAATDMNILLDTVASNDAAVVWCGGDLKTTGAFDANNGALIKTGPGTLTIATAARTGCQMFSHSRQGVHYDWITNMKANGDSPTQGYGNLTVCEGHLVIDTPNTVTNILGCYADVYDSSSYILVGCRNGATEAGSEPYGHLDIKSGTVYHNGLILVGYRNGTSATRPDADSGSSFNVYGGVFKRTGDTYNSVNVGFVNAYDDRPGLPSFNVYGGEVDYIQYIRLAVNRGARGKMLVAGSTVTGYGLYGAHDSGGTSADDEYMPQVEVHVCSNGVLATQMIQPCRSGYCDFTIRVTDGGTLRRAQAIEPIAAYATSPMKLVLDGGNVLLWGANYTVVPSSFKTRLGARISSIDATNAGTYTLGSEVVTDAELVPAGSADGGLRITGAASATLALTGGMSITGPLVIDDGVTVKFGADATTGAVTAEKSDMSLAFGWSGSRFAKLTAAGWNVAGITSVRLDGAWAAGTYDLVSLPPDAAIDLSRVMMKTASDTADASFATRTEDGRVVLSVTLAMRSVASYEWTNSAGGAWSDGGNWGDGMGSAPAGSDTRAVFATAASVAGTAVTLAEGVTIGGMTFSASPGYALSGATLTLDNAGGPATIAATAGDSEIAASVAMAGETYLNAASGATLGISGVVSGAWPLTVNANSGKGTVELSGANTFTATPCVRAGTLRVKSIANAGAASAVGAGSSVKVGTATFELDGTATTDKAFELVATTWNTKAVLAATAGSTLTVNGDVTVASGTIFAKTGAGMVVLNGTDGCYFPMGIAVDAGTLALGSKANVSTSYFVTVADGATLAMNAGAALNVRVLGGAGTVLWNGGTWLPAYGSSSYLPLAAYSATTSKIGAGGARIDLSDMWDSSVLALSGSWTTADGVATDGGITISSSHPATGYKLMTTAFTTGATYGFNGPVTLASGGVAKTTGAALSAHTVAVLANGAIAAAMSGSAAEEATVKNLTLAAGSSVFSYISGAGVCATLRATDSLSVAGTVYVTICSGTSTPEPANTAGTYAILRGPKGTLDASKFAMSPRYKAANGTFALDTSAADYDQITLTLASATLFNSQTERDYRRDFVWIAGSGKWTDAANWECGITPYDSYETRMQATFPSTVADGSVVTLGGNRIMSVLESAAPGDLWLVDGTVNPRGSGEIASIKTTAGTLHLPNVLGDDWRSTYMDATAGSTQAVEGAFNNVKQYVYMNYYTSGDAGTVRLENSLATKGAYLYGGTLEAHPDSFDATPAVSVQNGTLAFISSGEVMAKVLGEGTEPARGMNLRVADGADVMFVDDVSCTGPFVKTGAGTAYLGGSGAVTLGNANRGNADSAYLTAATEIPPNGTLPTDGLGVFSLAAGKLVLGLDDRQKVTVGGRLDIGQNIADYDENGDVLDSELEILGGTVNVIGDLNIGRSAGAYRRTRDSGEKKRNLTLTMRGGNLEFNGIYMAHDGQGYYNGTATINLYDGTMKSKGGYVNMAYHRTSHTEYGRAKSMINIYGGMFTNTASTLSINAGGNGVMDINLYGGDFAWTAPFKFDGGNANDVVNINLHGGTFTAPYITRNYGGAPIKFYFNGGAYRPTQDGATLKMNPTYAWTAVVVSTNGAAFDIPGSNTFTLNQALAHDSVLGATRDGGIRKRGTGTLLLSAENTFTGPCVAEAGVMRPTIATAVSGGVGASGSGVFDMNGFDLTVPELVGEGGTVSGGTLTVTGRVVTESFVQVDDVVLSGATFASNGENCLKVLSSAEGSMVVDFGRDESDPLPRGYAIKVAEIPSSSSLYVSGINTGRAGRWEIVGERRNEANGVVEIWAVLKPMGAMLIFR